MHCTSSYGLPILLLLGMWVAPALAGNQCPPPPNPNDFACPLDPDRATLQERDVDGDGVPDHSGQVGSFCGGVSPAQCGEVGSGVQIGLDLIISNPQTQTVTCSLPDFFGTNINVLIMGDTCESCLATGFGSATLPAGTTTDTTLKVVVSDDNGDICPCGGVVTCTFSTEVVCNDGADGDGDGLIDGEDPDCCVDADYDGFCGQQDCDDSNAFVHSPPNVSELRLSIQDGVTRLDWDAEPGSVADVVTGNLGDLLVDQGFSLASCLIDDALGTEITDTRSDPVPGQTYYYVKRLQNSCGAASYGEPPPFAPGGRADLDLISPCTTNLACDGCVFNGCDLLDPEPVCAGGQCLPLADSSDTTCIGPAGSGTQGDSCSDQGFQDCAPGHVCVFYGSDICVAWCRSNLDCVGSEFCVDFSPPVVLDGTAYGACLSL